MTKNVSIIIPVFNEQQGIKRVIDDIENLKAKHPDYEVIVVDDGSTDGLPHDEIRDRVDQLIIHPRNMGYGAAIKNGIRHAKGEIILFTDSLLDVRQKT